MEPRRPGSISTFILLSILLHFLVIFLVPRLEPPDFLTRPNEVEVLLDSGMRIADIAPPETPRRPEKARFLGNYDSTVPEETVATTPPHPDRGNGREESPLQSKPPEESSKEKKPEMLAVLAPDPALSRATRPEDVGSGGAGEGLGPVEDYYPDYKIGGHTYLNVQAHPDVQYFVRLKKAFKTTFNPVPALASYYYSNQITQGRVEVVVAISLDEKGEMEELFVLKDSGIRPYNEEVLRTVRDSAPFSSPPENLLGKDEKLRMAWAFRVYL